MTRLGLLALLLLSLGAESGLLWAADFLMIQGEQASVYDIIGESFLKTMRELGYLGEGSHFKVFKVDALSLTTSKYELKQELRLNPPDFVLVIGPRGFDFILTNGQEIATPPIFYCAIRENMQEALKLWPGKLTGVIVVTPAEETCQVYKKWFPDKTLTLIHDSAMHHYLIQEFQDAAQKASLTLKLIPVPDSTKIPELLATNFQRAEGIWVIPSREVLNVRIRDRFFAQAIVNQIPSISPVLDDLKEGALFTVTPDWQDIGIQLAEMAIKHLSAKDQPEPLPPKPQRKSLISINQRTISRLSTCIPGSLAGEAQWVEP